MDKKSLKVKIFLNLFGTYKNLYGVDLKHTTPVFLNFQFELGEVIFLYHEQIGLFAIDFVMVDNCSFNVRGLG